MFKKFIYLFILCIIVFAGVVGFIFYGLYQFYMPFGEGGVKTVVIEKGQGVKDIAAELKDENLISSPFWFKTYIWLSGKQVNLQAGEYSFGSGLSLVEVADSILQGKVVQNNIWVTTPEGFTSKQIEGRLAESGLFSANGLVSVGLDDFRAEYESLKDLPAKASLEGFLFPDTYKFEKDAAQDEILDKMLSNFESKLTGKMRSDIASQGRTIFEIVIMASILEKEVKTGVDRKIASGIFWQRLADKYPLQSDATLSYIFDDNYTRHTIEQTKVDSPYNTYKYIGLPPGPINNPGLDAIEAAIYPQKTDYYFFITKPDTGEAVFAKTLEEHNLNKAKFLK
ncbi:MAG: endolytic transglycosylase MltG [bacterium]